MNIKEKILLIIYFLIFVVVAIVIKYSFLALDTLFVLQVARIFGVNL